MSFQESQPVQAIDEAAAVESVQTPASAGPCVDGDAACAMALEQCPAAPVPDLCAATVAGCETGDLACLAAAVQAELPGPAAVASDTTMLAGAMGIIDAGGPIIVILVGLSLLSLAIITAKVAQFTWLNLSARSFVQRASDRVKAGDLAGALSDLERRRNPVAKVMAAAVQGRILGGDEAATREEVTRIAQSQLEDMEAGLPYLSLVATISPLLGLLGTVLGMIDAFQQLEGAGDRVDPAILSGGIWEALLTTAAGLSVAIPAAAVFTWLQRTVDVTAQRMEDAATRVFTVELFSKPAREAAPAPAPKAPSSAAREPEPA